MINKVMELAYRLAKENEIEYRVEFTKDFNCVVITFENHFNNLAVSKMFDIDVLNSYSVREAFESHLEQVLKGSIEEILG